MTEANDTFSVDDDTLSDMIVDFRVNGGTPELGQLSFEDENGLVKIFSKTNIKWLKACFIDLFRK